MKSVFGLAIWINIFVRLSLLWGGCGSERGRFGKLVDPKDQGRKGEVGRKNSQRLGLSSSIKKKGVEHFDMNISLD